MGKDEYFGCAFGEDDAGKAAGEGLFINVGVGEDAVAKLGSVVRLDAPAIGVVIPAGIGVQ